MKYSSDIQIMTGKNDFDRNRFNKDNAVFKQYKTKQKRNI